MRYKASGISSGLYGRIKSYSVSFILEKMIINL